MGRGCLGNDRVHIFPGTADPCFYPLQAGIRSLERSLYEVNLKLFDRHCHRLSEGAVAELSQEMVDEWCRQRKNEENNSCRSRIYVVVSFIKFLRDRGLTSVCPPEVPRKETRTYIPHAFTDEELTAFFQECDKVPARKNNLQDACRRLTVPVFFRLLYSSGIRTNEARLLECKDVDLVNGIINVRYSKGHDQHYIVLHDTMLELMKKYNEAVSLLAPDRTYFFPSRDGSYYKKRLGNEDYPELKFNHYAAKGDIYHGIECKMDQTGYRHRRCGSHLFEGLFLKGHYK